MKKILKIIVLFIIISPLWSQNFGLAVQDGTYAPLINPAAMGVGNSEGIGYINRFNSDEGLIKDYDLIFSLGNIAYSYGQSFGTDKHLAAAGFDLGMGSYGGISYQWVQGQDKLGGLGLSFMVRPTDYISLAVKGVDLTTEGYTVLGAGFRPLFFAGNLASRLTLSADVRLQDSRWDDILLGAFLEPVNGLKFYGGYNLDEENYQVGVSLSLSYLETGSSLDDTGENGSFQAFSTFKKQRTFIDYAAHKAIDYDLADVILDTPVQGYSSVFPRKGVRTLIDFLADMESIRKDSSIKALIFRNQDFRTSFANLLEIEEILLELKKSGKKIYFYYDTVASLPFTLAASVADGIYLNPAGTVNLTGFSLTNIYLKDFLAAWGIQVHNYQSHAYKTAYNSLSESAMTEEERESLQYLFDGLQMQMNRMLENGRGDKIQGSAQSVIDQGPFIYGTRALSLGLVDQLLYEDEFDGLLKQKKLRPVKASMIPGSFRYDWDAAAKPVIEVIYARGNIKMGEGVAGENIGAGSMVRALRNARRNPLVKGIILRVESGGGSTLASDLIAREIALCRTGDNPKPVIVSMGGTAASGGYYISAPAAAIVASPVTVTGSIGVIAVMPEITGFLEKYGIGEGTVKTAEHADTGNILKSVSPDEDEMMREYIAESYDRFITLVGEYRNMPVSQVHESAQGRVWTGAQAEERNLVDRTGGLTTAFSLMKEMTGTRQDFRLIEVVPGRNQTLLERTLNPPLMSRIGAELPLPEDILNLMKLIEQLKGFEEERALYLMPYTPEELGVSTR